MKTGVRGCQIQLDLSPKVTVVKLANHNLPQ
jgi:hypothetical protein